MGRSFLDDVLHHGDQAVLGQWLQQEPVGSGFVGAGARRENGEDDHGEVPGVGRRSELPTQREPIDLGNQDLADHEIRRAGPDLVERLLPVERELDPMARVREEPCAEGTNVRIALHEQDVER